MPKYKPGQLITINHNIYRVKGGFSCFNCSFYKEISCFNCSFYEKNCRKLFPNCVAKIGFGYLQEIKPKNR